jgi:pyruvate,water dikinase
MQNRDTISGKAHQRADSTCSLSEFSGEGGKGTNLRRLKEGGFNVPLWVVIKPESLHESLSREQAKFLERLAASSACDDAASVDALMENLQPSPSVDKQIKLHCKKLFAGNSTVAVRSSAQDEDGSKNSFAGQLDSFLGVSEDGVSEAVSSVWKSAFNTRILQYRRTHGLPLDHLAPAVIIQRMVKADAAGVAFSADPASGNRDHVVIAATLGLGSSLVSGQTDVDHFVVNRIGRIIEQNIGCKTVIESLDEQGALRVEETQANQCSISESQIRMIAQTCRDIEQYFGCPQDVEWAISNGELYILQTRPITGLPAQKPAPSTHKRQAESAAQGILTIWDNSNIGESYQGVTTPLTFSFARKAYENVYIQFCKMMGVSSRKINQNRQIFPRMIGLIKGRIYYNLINWYRLLAMLPGFNVNRPFMEQMMGVKETLPSSIVSPADSIGTIEKLRDATELTLSTIKIARSFSNIDSQIVEFNNRFEEALHQVPDDVESLPLPELVHIYRELEERLLTKWDAPLSNDFFAMVFYGLLRTLTNKWCGDLDGTLQNDLLCAEGGIISTQPAKLMQEMAMLARSDCRFTDSLVRGDIDLAHSCAPKGFIELYESFVSQFGDRCVEELKLESATLKEDPRALLRNVGQMAKASPKEQSESVQSSIAQDLRSKAEKRVAAALKAHPLRQVLFTFVLRHARWRVRDRENLRFQRTRLFGKVRTIFNAIGDRLVAMNALLRTDDIFYLEVEEIFSYIEGASSSTNLKELVLLRQREFDAYRQERAPADRIKTFDVVYLSQFENQAGQDPQIIKTQLKGIGCCPGIVRGPVRVVTDPRTAAPLDGEILVAKRTDPGWIVIFPQARGILVEHGSVLSHSAIVARELGIPAVVSVANLTSWLCDGDWVEFDGSTGVIRRVPSPDGNAGPSSSSVHKLFGSNSCAPAVAIQ